MQVSDSKEEANLLKLISAGLVLVGVAISIIPVVTGMYHESEKGNDKWASQPTASRVLWPFASCWALVSCFCMEVSNHICLLQFPAALMNVIEELSQKGLKKSGTYFISYYWSSLYQLLTVGLLFWADIVPEFGYAKGIQEFGRK